MATVENLKLIRFLTGEEVIAELVSETNDTLTLKNPVRVVVVPGTDPNNPKVGFAPFASWSDDKVLTISRFHVTFTATPITDFVNNYNGMFGGLVLPKSEILKP